MSTNDAHSEAWREAGERLEAYLRSCQLMDPRRRWELALEILATSREQQSAAAECSPLETTMRIAFSRMEQWFGTFVATEPSTSARKWEAALALWCATDACQKWSADFLKDAPPELREQLSSDTLVTAPKLAFQRLRSSDVDYGPMATIGRETWEKFSWSYVLKAFALWAFIFFAAWGTWLRFHV